MPITAKCDSCSAQFKVKDELAGKKVKCPKCAKPFRIPTVAGNGGDQKTATPAKPARVPPVVEEYKMSPAHNPMLDLLDDAGVESAPLGPVCNNCGSDMPPTAIICVECGFNNDTGKQLETTTYKDPDEIDAGLSDAEKLLARAERDIEESPISAEGQDFGDGADSFLIAIVAMAVAVVLIGIGVGTIFVMDKIGENINTALISVFGSIAIYAFCAIWIMIVAFKAKPLHGLGCLLSAGVYCIIFGFMQGRALMIPTLICLIAIVIGAISWTVYSFSTAALLLDSVQIVTIV